jgi:hypothetical protein
VAAAVGWVLDRAVRLALPIAAGGTGSIDFMGCLSLSTAPCRHESLFAVVFRPPLHPLNRPRNGGLVAEAAAQAFALDGAGRNVWRGLRSWAACAMSLHAGCLESGVGAAATVAKRLQRRTSQVGPASLTWRMHGMTAPTP